MTSKARCLWIQLASAAALALALHASDANACGGFFCGQQPVDQTAERILFEVGDDSVTMTTQISFNGKAEDFAWVLPLSAVPDPESLGLFSQRALNALDTNTGPVFVQPSDSACYGATRGNCITCASGPVYADTDAPSVTVYIRTEVGDYQVAVVASPDPQALVDWLRTAGYRITPSMEPYIAQYTTEGLKFLALKLRDTADVKDLKPFRFTLPGTAPSIPLRMTALAAEPEMSILVFVLGDQRYEGKNWTNLSIADDQIRYNPFSYSFPIATNWSKLVAEAVDGAGGQGWVTELAGPSASYAALVRAQLESGNFATPDDEQAATDLLGVLEAHPYLTRLYTRLSAEEMTRDPVLGRSAAGDVAREHQLSRLVNGVDQCDEDVQTSTDPCDFTTCGAAGFCRTVSTPAANTGASSTVRVAGCACLPGATARTSIAADGSASVLCQDGRLSFLNPGDRETPDGAALPDPCATFSCGDKGRCIAMNMTPTCVCDQGFVAVGSLGADGARATRCVAPPELVPAVFYAGSLPALPAELPGGRDVEPGAATAMPDPGSPGSTEPDPGGFPMPRTNPALASRDDGACSLSSASGKAAGQGSNGAAPWLLVLGAGLAGWRRRYRA